MAWVVRQAAILLLNLSAGSPPIYVLKPRHLGKGTKELALSHYGTAFTRRYE